MIRRLLPPAAFAALACLAPAQVGGWRAVAAGIRELGERGRLPGPQPNPLAPPVGEPLKVPSGLLPEAAPNTKSFQLIRSGDATKEGDRVRATGGVEFLYEGYRTFADEVDGNLATKVFSLSGNVRVIGSDSVIAGEQVNVDYGRRTFSGIGSTAVFTPKLVGGQIRDNLYGIGGVTYGSRNNQHAYGSSTTTCSYLDHPHFEIEAADTDIRPNRRLVYRDARLRLFEKTLLRVPFLSIPLDSRSSRYTPDVGQNQDEGYYIKNRFGVPLKSDGNDLDARVDYMTKLGQGLGADYAYRNPLLDGLLRVYSVSNLDALTVNSQHRQRFSWGEFGLDTDYQRNNYLTSPGSTILASRSQLAIPQRAGTTTLSFNRTANEASGSSTENQAIGLSDNRQIFGGVRTTTDVTLASNSSQFGGTTSSAQRQMDVRFRGTRDVGFGQANLDYQRTIPVGDTANFFGGADRTPVFSLASDAGQLFGQTFARSWPFRAELSLGEFGNFDQTRITRSRFDFDFNKSDRADKRFRVDVGGRFNQGIYSDDTAQYVVGSSLAASYRLGRDTSANVRYNYLRPEGFTPLPLDTTGQTHLATADLSARPTRSVLLGLQSGYDFLRPRTQDVAWQQVGARAEWTPARWFSLRSLGTYDTIGRVWSGVRLDSTYRFGASLLTLGARYDGYQQKWSNVNAYLNNLKIGRTRLSAAAAYNGFTKQFDALQYNAVYDLHCFEAVLTVAEYKNGFRPGREIQFFIRLKALPFDGIFGIGRRGQPLGTSTGTDF